MKRVTSILAIITIATTALLLGCGIKPKPFEYEPVTEMKNEPGVFSGDSGEWTIRVPVGESAAEKPQPAAETRPPASEIAPADMEEFRRFQQWKQDKQEFEAFQEWKRSYEGSREYDEFLEWKRWQSFRRWQEAQPKSD